MSLRRYWDLIAVSEVLLSSGPYVEQIIRPLIETH